MPNKLYRHTIGSIYKEVASLVQTLLMAEGLGVRVRRLRKNARLSQDALARAVGMSRQHVFQVERGVHENMRMDTVGRYAAALGVSEQYLLSGREVNEMEGERLPALDSYLRSALDLEEDQIAHVERSIAAFAAERRLAQSLANTDHEPQEVRLLEEDDEPADTSGLAASKPDPAGRKRAERGPAEER